MDKLGAYNQALSAIGGRSTIESLTESSKEKRELDLVFDDEVRRILVAAPWDFATYSITTEDLQEVLPNPAGQLPPQFKHAWVRPDKMLLVQAVFVDPKSVALATPIFPGGYGQSSPCGGARDQFATQWINGGRVILTVTDSPVIRYTYLQNNLANWSDGALECLVAALAARVGFAITGDKGVRDRLKEESLVVLSRHKTSAANEAVEVLEYPSEFISARNAEAC